MTKRIKYSVLALLCAQACMMPMPARAAWSRNKMVGVGSAAIAAVAIPYFVYRNLAHAKRLCKRIDDLRKRACLKELNQNKIAKQALIRGKHMRYRLYNVADNDQLLAILKKGNLQRYKVVSGKYKHDNTEFDKHDESDLVNELKNIVKAEKAYLSHYIKELERLVTGTNKVLEKLILPENQDPLNEQECDGSVTDEVERLRQGAGWFSRPYRADALQLRYDLYKKQERLDAINAFVCDYTPAQPETDGCTTCHHLVCTHATTTT